VYTGSHGISVESNSKLQAEDTLVQSAPTHGVLVYGAASSATLVKCTIKDTVASGVALAAGASLLATNCVLSGSRESMGLQAEGPGTKARLVHTEVSNNKGSGVCPLPVEARLSPCPCMQYISRTVVAL
jgi:hypothetical protein